MHARVSQFRVRPGKLEDFKRAVASMKPKAREQRGFRALLVLRTGDAGLEDATVITVWDSIADLRATEKNLTFYQAVTRFMAFSEGFPAVREHEVLVSDFAPD